MESDMLGLITCDLVMWRDASLPFDHAPLKISVVPSRLKMTSVYSTAKQLDDNATL